MIFELLGRKVPKKLIEFFLKNPTGKFYEAEVVKKTKLSKMSVHHLNQSNPVVKMLKTIKVIDDVHPGMRKIKNAQIFLYGSAALGENTEKSDIH